MPMFLRLIVCLFVVFTLVTCVSCKKKEEAAPAPIEEVGPVGEAPPAQGGHR
jgi:photosystem II stability/assembly factor-like uncharacterized protein